MANPLIGQILGSVFGRSTGGGGTLGGGGLGGGLPGGLGSVLGSVFGGAGSPAGAPTGVPRGGVGGLGGAGGRNAMLALLLPLVLQWVQRSGGVGNVLQRIGQQGYGGQADSWVGAGANQPLPSQAAHELLGPDELARMSSQLGVGADEVAHGVSEILPELVDHLSPQGQLPGDADKTLDAGQSALEQMLSQVR